MFRFQDSHLDIVNQLSSFSLKIMKMINSTKAFEECLGKEPFEVFGFSSEDELDIALIPLMQEIPHEGQSKHLQPMSSTF